MTRRVQVSLPWPAAKLSPNGRGAWQTKESARGQAKQCGYINAARFMQGNFPPKQPLSIRIEVHPPNRRRYDWDGIVGRLKYYQDGIFDYFGLDDNCIKRAEVIMGEVTPGGAVNVTIEEWRAE